MKVLRPLCTNAAVIDGGEEAFDGAAINLLERRTIISGFHGNFQFMVLFFDPAINHLGSRSALEVA